MYQNKKNPKLWIKIAIMNIHSYNSETYFLENYGIDYFPPIPWDLKDKETVAMLVPHKIAVNKIFFFLKVLPTWSP